MLSVVSSELLGVTVPFSVAESCVTEVAARVVAKGDETDELVVAF